MRSRFMAPLVWQCLAALVIVAGLTATLSLFLSELSTPVIALLYLLPVLLSASIWGLVPGLCSAAAGFLVFNYFFIQPLYTFHVTEPRDLLALFVYLAVATLVGQSVGRARMNLLVAQQREREAKALYDLSADLSTQADLSGILSAVAEHVMIVFEPAACEIRLDPALGQPSARLLHPPEASGRFAIDLLTSVQAPLGTTRGPLGEIRLYLRPGQRQEGEDRRLLSAFATQTGLVIERALLAQTAMRAQILEQSDRLKSALLSSVSHDFRSPLAAIQAATTSLQGQDVAWSEVDRADFLATIIEEAERLNRLVDNLLDMSRIEAGMLQPKRDWYPIEEVIGAVARRLRRRRGSPPLSVQLEDNLPLVPLDFLQIDRVLTNLIENSLRHAPRGSPVQVVARVQEPFLEVRVYNRGPHIPPEDLERIFDKFYRLGAGDRVQGTGLGLSICKGIIEAHGGRIWAENVPEGGVAFHFTLPLTLDGAGPPAVAEGELEWPEPTSSS